MLQLAHAQDTGPSPRIQASRGWGLPLSPKNACLGAAQVRAEITYNARRIGSHASLAILCVSRLRVAQHRPHAWRR